MLDVIGLGFGRSGTMSLKAALEMLGFGPCYHFSTMFDRPGDAARWRSAARGAQIDWEPLLGEFRATVYLPPTLDFTTLLERYPRAKAILLVREPQSWHRSYRDTVYRFNRLTPLRSLYLRGRGLFDEEIRRFHEAQVLQQETLWDGIFHGRFEDAAYAIGRYNARIEEIRQAAPADRLLVYRIQQGWEPLCHFLELPCPAEPFPRLNDTESFIEWRKGKKQP